MNSSDLYKKIPWIHQMPNIFRNEIISNARLDTLATEDQRNLIYKIIISIYDYFGIVPGNVIIKAFSSDTEKYKEVLISILEIWLSGLCDLSVSQIIFGLLDIINLKTEYQKWPPKSVMEFYAICKKQRPPYYEDFKQKENIKKIEFNNEKAEGITRHCQVRSMCHAFKSLGRNYLSHIEKNIFELENKSKRTVKEEKLLDSIKKSREELLAINSKTSIYLK